MKIAVVIAKFLLGLAFIVLGANHFVHFIPQPPLESDTSKAFLGVLMSTGYMNVVKILEILGGAMILSGRLAPLGLLILGPILVNIFLYDALMDPKGLPVVIVLMGLAVLIGYRHKDYFAPFFQVRADHCTFKGK
jgi:putative oxidoreductase